MKNALGQLIGTNNFSEYRIGGGGFVIGFDASNDNLTQVCNMDVFNAYLRCPTLFGDDEWKPIFTPSNLQTAEYDPKPNNGALVDAFGGFAAAVAPSDYRVAYVAFNAFAYRVDISLAGVVTVTRCNRAAKKQYSNSGAQRYWNDKIAVHPSDANIALFGTTNDGITYTTNGGTTMTAVNGTIPANTDRGGHATPYLVAIAPNGTDCYIHVQGTGLYRSTTGVSGTFTLLSGAPTFCSHLYIAPNGNIYCCDPNAAAGESIKKYNGSWSTVTTPAITVLSIAIDPALQSHIVAVSEDQFPIQSYDTGATWLGQWFSNEWKQNAVDDVPWLDGKGMFWSKIQFEKTGTGTLWGAHGLGVCYSTPPLTRVFWNWYSKTRGIEELVSNNGLSVTGKPITALGCWDKPIWRKTNPDSFGGTFLTPSPSDDILHAWQFDYAADDLDYWVVKATTNANDRSGKSTNAGQSWTKIWPANIPEATADGPGGAIAVNAKAQQILISANNKRAICTTDEWATWNFLPIDPNISGAGNWIAANYIRRNLVTADKTRPGVFAIIMNGDNQGADKQGLWVTTTGPMGTWSRNVIGRLDSTGDPADYWACTLQYIPGKSGELLYTTGGDFASRLLHFTGDGLTTAKVDIGAAFGITNVDKFSFGAKLDVSQNYPTLYFYGTVSGVRGLYRTMDMCATAPTLLSRFPNNSVDSVSALCADMNVFGLVYVGYVGSGWVYCKYGKNFSLV